MWHGNDGYDDDDDDDDDDDNDEDIYDVGGVDDDDDESDPPYDSDSDSSSVTSESRHDFVPVQFPKMCDAIESVVDEEDSDCVIVTADGGRGKTTATYKVKLQWANGLCLLKYFAVVRIDMKRVHYDKDLFENMLIQYPIIAGAYSTEELRELKEVFRIYQHEIFWLMDSLDESSSRHRAQQFLIVPSI